MSDYYPFESAFETSDFTEWSAGKTDTDSRMTCDHYSTLVTNLGMYPEAIPWRGAYCAHVDLSVAGGHDAYVQEDTAFDTAVGVTIWVSFYVQVTSNLTMANTDRFTIFTLQSTTPTDEATVSVYMNGTVPQLVAGETGSTAVGAGTRATDLVLNTWHFVEMGCAIAAGTGTIAFYVDGYQIGANITTLTQAAIIQARLGTIGLDAGTTAGHVLFDNLRVTPTRLGPVRNRFPQTVPITKSGFVALGPGKVDMYALVAGGGADNHMAVYDTDILPYTNVSDMLGPVLANGNPFESVPFLFPARSGYFGKGCYVLLTGTAPRATVTMGMYNSTVGTIKNYAVRRRP